MQNRECDHENPLKEKQQIETTPTWETTPTKNMKISHKPQVPSSEIDRGETF